MAFLVRDEESQDRDMIRRVVTAAFGRADEADLVDRLRSDGDNVISLVATGEAGLVGHALFTRMKAPFRAVGMAPVSVLPERQGLGIGSRLIQAGLERARRGCWDAVFVLGEPEFYRRFGFDPALASRFTSPYAGPYLMAIALRGTLPVASGRIDYAPAFAALG